jgi:hypothetical protein
MALQHVGGGRFVDDPLTEDEIRRAAPKEWTPRLQGLQVRPWVEFVTLETARYGLLLFDPEGREIDTKTVGRDRLSPDGVAPLTLFEEAFDLVRRESRLLDEYPFVEVETKEKYDLVREAQAVEESGWEGPGVYDFRERPPTRQAESVEAYELEGMEFWAGDILDGMFQGDEWKRHLRDLLSSAA